MIALWAIVGASLLGSLHCASMCGPLVAFYSGDRGVRWHAHALYNGSRLLGYLVLGAAAGAAGGALDGVGSLLSVHRAAAIVCGALILGWGILSLLAALGVRLPLVGSLSARPPALVKLRTRPPLVRAAALGALTPALPCGWLWAFVLSAASTGSWYAGAAAMAAFWVGTVPALVGFGVAFRHLAQALGRKLPVLTAALLIVLGLSAIAMRAPLLTSPDHDDAACHEH